MAKGSNAIVALVGAAAVGVGVWFWMKNKGGVVLPPPTTTKTEFVSAYWEDRVNWLAYPHITYVENDVRSLPTWLSLNFINRDTVDHVYKIAAYLGNTLISTWVAPNINLGDLPIAPGGGLTWSFYMTIPTSLPAGDYAVNIKLTDNSTAVALGEFDTGVTITYLKSGTPDPIVAPVIPPPPVGQASILVQTSPIVGEVFLGGVSQGFAPVTLTVNPGTYVISFGPDPTGVLITPGGQTVVAVANQSYVVTGAYGTPAPKIDFYSIYWEDPVTWAQFPSLTYQRANPLAAPARLAINAMNVDTVAHQYRTQVYFNGVLQADWLLIPDSGTIAAGGAIIWTKGVSISMTFPLGTYTVGVRMLDATTGEFLGEVMPTVCTITVV